MNEKDAVKYIADSLQNHDIPQGNIHFSYKMSRLMELYNKISVIYNKPETLSKFVTLIQKYILLKKDERFTQFPKKEIFIEFYSLYICLKDSLLDNRKVKINELLNLYPDLVNIIIKYDRYFYGLLESQLTGHTRDITFLTILPDNTIITGSKDGTLRMWNPNKILHVHSGPILCACSLPNKKIIIGSNDASLRICNIETGIIENILRGYGNHITSITLLPDNRVMSTSLDYTLTVWNLETYKADKIRNIDYPAPNYFVIPHNKIINQCPNGNLKIWNIDTNETSYLPGSIYMTFFSVNNMGKMICGSKDFILSVWDFEGCQFVLKGHTGDITCVADLPDGRLISGSYDRTLRIWNQEKCEIVLSGHMEQISHIAARSDGTIISVSGKTIKIWR